MHIYGPPGRRGLLRMIMPLGLPILVYAAFLMLYLPQRGIVEASEGDFAGRAELFNENFSGEWAGESLSFLYLAVGLPLFLILMYAYHSTLSGLRRVFVHAFIFTLFLNTIIVLVASQAREARLFMLPVLLILPFLGGAWLHDRQRMGGLPGYFRIRHHWPSILLFVFGAALIVLVSDHVFRLSDGVPSSNLHHEYFMAQSFWILLNVLNTAYWNRTQRLTDHRSAPIQRH